MSDLSLILEAALKSGGDIIALYQSVKADEARCAFYKAKADALKSMPIIKHNRKVSYGGTEYTYADLSEMLTAVSEKLASCGLTLQFSHDVIVDNAKQYAVSTQLTITHIAGHFEVSNIVFPVAAGKGQSLMQSIAGTITFSKRYLLAGALALAVESDDTEERMKDGFEDHMPKMAPVKTAYTAELEKTTAPPSSITIGVNPEKIPIAKSITSASFEEIEMAQQRLLEAKDDGFIKDEEYDAAIMKMNKHPTAEYVNKIIARLDELKENDDINY